MSLKEPVKLITVTFTSLPTCFSLSSPVSPSPLCVVFPLSTSILKATAPDEEDQSGPAPSTGHRLLPRDHSARWFDRFLSDQSRPLLYQRELDMKKEEEEEIPTSYVSRRKDFLWGKKNLWNARRLRSWMFWGVFKFLSKFVCCVRETPVQIWQGEFFREMGEMYALSWPQGAAWRQTPFTVCAHFCVLLCTHRRGCMKQCFFPDECLHICLVLK